MTRPRGGRTASSALHGRCRTLQRPLSIVTNGGSVGAAMRRFWNVVTGLSVVVAAHAVTAGLVHLLPGDSMSGTHRVHVPLATLAILLAPLSAIAAERRSRVSRAKAWPRVLLLMAFLLIEAGATHGVGAQLFHDPWVLLAPAAVVLVQKGTCLLSDAVVELLGGIGSPSGGVTPHRHRGARHARAAVRRGLLDPRRGRAPPLPLC